MRYQPGKRGGVKRKRELGDSRALEIPRGAGSQSRPSLGFDERTDEMVVTQRGGRKVRRTLYER